MTPDDLAVPRFSDEPFRTDGEGQKLKGEVVRFLVVGGINTLFGYAAYLGGLWLGLPYPVAALMSQIAGTVFNYFTYSRAVFKSSPTSARFIRFATSYIVLYGISLVLLTVFQWLGATASIAGIFAAVLMPIFSFVFNKFFVFQRSTKKDSPWQKQSPS